MVQKIGRRFGTGHGHGGPSRGIELATKLVSAYLRGTAASPEAFGPLLSAAFEAIQDLRRLEAEGPGSDERRRRRHRSVPCDPNGAGIGSALPGVGDVPADPDRDRADGYVRNGIQTVTQDRLVCLEDRREVTFLKRHLRSLGVEPADYRRRWRLPSDYPMTAPAYVARRRESARISGFGRLIRPTRETEARAVRPLRTAGIGRDRQPRD